ncbi:MAG: CBS domain-containing protein [Vulcanibacillus sp.]
MRNSDRFLLAYNLIEKALKQYSPNEHFTSFPKLIFNAKGSNAVVRKYYDDLKEFAELRNAIVHDSFDTIHAIAEPHDKIVEKIENIMQEISAPKKAIPFFESDVTVFQSNNSLKDILIAINKFSYSKFPVYENKIYIGLLTKTNIIDWLAKKVDSLDRLSFSEILIKDILSQQKKPKNYMFINKNITIYDIREIFYKSTFKDQKIEALLISDNGSENGKLLGIITPADLIKIP